MNLEKPKRPTFWNGGSTNFAKAAKKNRQTKALFGRAPPQRLQLHATVSITVEVLFCHV